jgi:hypothetical protein
MSDVSQGQGWWQASDGKWYSPEEKPDHRPPPPPSARRTVSTASTRRTVSSGGVNDFDGAMMALRGASVGKVNRRRVVQVIEALSVATLAILTIIFFVAGIHRNNQISDLKSNGVTVNIKVTGCLALIGGTGSNPAGYVCQGALTIAGHHYTEVIPGSDQLPKGKILKVVVVPNDPALLTLRHTLLQEHSSGTVFILPAILLAALLVLIGALVAQRRHRAPGTGVVGHREGSSPQVA